MPLDDPIEYSSVHVKTPLYTNILSQRSTFYLHKFYFKTNVKVNFYHFLASKSMFIVKGTLTIVSKIYLINYR